MTLDHANGSAVLDESDPSSDLPPLSPPSRSALFGFGSLPGEGTEDEPESPSDPLGDPGSDSATGWPPDEDDESPDDSDPSSSLGSSRADTPAALLSKAQMRATARTAVTISTGMVHTVAAKSEAQRAVGLYLADEDDAAAIGNPLGDLMHRRGDVVGGKLSPEANDFLRALMGVAGYLTKQVQKVGAIRQHEAQVAATRTADTVTYPDAAA